MKIDEEIINNKITHTYNHIKRKTTTKKINIVNDTLRRQISYYQTTIDKCQCGDNKIESALYGIDIPCFLRISLGANFPECPKVKLVLKEKFSNLAVEYNPVRYDDLFDFYDEDQLNKEYPEPLLTLLLGV